MSKKGVVVVAVIGAALVVGAWYYGRNGMYLGPGGRTNISTSSSQNGVIANAPVFTTAKETRTSLQKYCVFEVSYPQARIEGNADLETWLNTYLKAQFVPSNAQVESCEASAREFSTTPVTETTTVSHNVKLATGDLVSVTHVSSSYFEGAAHPNNLITAFTIDLANRQVVSFEELLRPNSLTAFNDLLYEAVTAALAAADGGAEPYFDRPTFLREYTKQSYDFYLTRDALVVVGLFDIHALSGVEAPIPLHTLKPYMNPNGILLRLVSEDA